MWRWKREFTNIGWQLEDVAQERMFTSLMRAQPQLGAGPTRVPDAPQAALESVENEVLDSALRCGSRPGALKAWLARRPQPREAQLAVDVRAARKGSEAWRALRRERDRLSRKRKSILRKQQLQSLSRGKKFTKTPHDMEFGKTY